MPAILASPERPSARYERLRDAAVAATAAGDLERALALYDEACECAEADGDPELVDLARCNRAGVAIEIGQRDDVVPAMRSILMRRTSGVTCFLAAYAVARVYELDKDFRKALFYARVAEQQIPALSGRQFLVASSHNQLGNLLLAQSFAADASREYELALALMPTAPSVWRARMEDNLGYCRVLEGRVGEGFTLLYQSLRTLRRFGAERYAISTHLDLAYAHLEVGRLRDARRHGGRALDLAERFADTDSLKNALYLLGQAAAADGDGDLARSTFDRLQRFYPGTPFLTDFLISVDVRKVINLRA